MGHRRPATGRHTHKRSVSMAEEGCKLFIYGVDENLPNGELQGEFEKFGRVVDVYNTGKGFAFVTFDQKEDAATAIREMDGANVCGQQIKVNVCGRGGGGYGGGGGGY